MRGVDLSVYRFDYDLTFAILLMNADGTIYHTFAGRDRKDPMSHLSLTALVRVMNATAGEHARRTPPAPARAAAGRLTVESMPRIHPPRKAPSCYHCHMVHDAMHDAAIAAKRPRDETIWVWPDPVQVGLSLDGEEQTAVKGVAAGSAAAKAGLRPGDRIVAFGDSAPLTFGDLQRVLHEAPPGPARIPVVYERSGGTKRAELALPSGWKRAAPEVYAWRPYKWNLGPRAGFGGPRLSDDELKRAGLEPGGFAFRVNYIVDWGPHAHTGRNAHAAGIRKGDVVYSVSGVEEFESVEHFHAWYCLTRKTGSKVEVALLRDGARRKVTMEVVE